MLSLACSYPCIYCGPPGFSDMSYNETDNMLEAYNIMDNFKVALTNRCVKMDVKMEPSDFGVSVNSSLG